MNTRSEWHTSNAEGRKSGNEVTSKWNVRKIWDARYVKQHKLWKILQSVSVTGNILYLHLITESNWDGLDVTDESL